MAALVTQAEAERRLGPQTVARLCDDDGDGVADAAVVDMLLVEASDEGLSLLWPGWPSEDSIRQLVEADSSVRGDLCRLFAELAAQRRPQLLNDRGETPYTESAKRARKHLRDISQARARSVGEAAAGANQNFRGRTNRDTDWRPTFAADSEDDTGPGGF